VAVFAAIAMLVISLIVGVALKWSGPVLSAVAVTNGLLAELLVLSFAWSKAQAAIRVAA
jgi:hypothetical protein